MDRQLVDHVAGVPCRVVHRTHPRTLFRCAVFQQCREDLGRDAARQQVGQYLVLVRFIIVDGRSAFAFLHIEPGRDDLGFGRDLADHTFILREEDRRHIKFAAVKSGKDVTGDVLRVGIADPLYLAKVNVADQVVAPFPAQLLAALFADRQYFYSLFSGSQSLGPCLGEPHNRRVEATAKSAFGRHDHQKMRLITSRPTQKRRCRFAVTHACRKFRHHRIEPLGIGPRRFCRFVSAPQLGGGDHLHRLGDLPGRCDRVDPRFQVLKVRHLSCPLGAQLRRNQRRIRQARP